MKEFEIWYQKDILCSNLTDKTTADAKILVGKKTDGWVKSMLPWQDAELADFFKERCIIGSSLENGIRSGKEAMYFTAMILDFDQGIVTWEAFKNKARTFKFSVFAMTTVSHQKIKKEGEEALDRFRAIIPFGKALSGEDKTQLEMLILDQFPDGSLDMASFRPGQYFFGSPNGEVFINTFLDERTQDPVFLSISVLAQDNPKLLERTSGKKRKLTEKQKEIHSGIEVLVTTAKKEIFRVKDLPIKQPGDKIQILCPFCNPDERANPDKTNAFASANQFGHFYIYCCSEDHTYWFNPSEARILDCLQFALCESVKKVVEIRKGKPMYIFNDKDDLTNRLMQATPRINPLMAKFFPRISIEYMPNKPFGLDPANMEVFNLYQHTEHITKDRTNYPIIKYDDSIKWLRENTPYTYKVLDNIIGNDGYIKYFINWLSCLAQLKKRARTAWIFSNPQEGAGKGMLFSRVLKPIFGHEHCKLTNGSEIGDNFSGVDYENIFLLAFDEVMTRLEKMVDNETKERLKSNIANEEITIKHKYAAKYNVVNITNLLIFSNHERPIPVGGTDRRYNAIRNEKAVNLTTTSWGSNGSDLADKLTEEMPTFADLLCTLEIDEIKFQNCLETDFKDKLKDQSVNKHALVSRALYQKDAEFFDLNFSLPPTEEERHFADPDEEFISKEAKRAYKYIKNNGALPAEYIDRVLLYLYGRNINLHKLKQELKSEYLFKTTVSSDVNKGSTFKAYKSLKEKTHDKTTNTQ